MSSQLKRKAFTQGQTILQEGQPVSAACMIVKGAVHVYREVDGNRVVLAELKDGQIFGEMGLLSGQTAVASVEAIEDTEIAYIDQVLLKTSLLKSPKPIQRVVQYLISRLRHTNQMVAPGGAPVGQSAPAATGGKDRYFQRSPNSFLGMCFILEMMYKGSAQAGARGGEQFAGVSFKEYARAVKHILPVSETEVQETLTRLAKLNILKVADTKETYYRKDALGRAQKSSVHITDRTYFINDPANFITIARNLDRELRKQDEKIDEKNLEFIDIADAVELVDTTEEMFYKKLGNQEVPSEMFFLEKSSLLRWAKEVGEDFFKKTKRKRLNIDELESIDDITFVDNPTVQEVFKQLDFRKLTILFTAAGDEARAKMKSNMSQKILTVVEEESQDMEVDDMELGDIENELYDRIRKIKGVKKA